MVGMFAYYANWIPNFSDKIQPLVNDTSFPLDESVPSAFDLLKKELERATLQPIDESQPFVVECDASEVCVSATLSTVDNLLQSCQEHSKVVNSITHSLKRKQQLP